MGVSSKQVGMEQLLTSFVNGGGLEDCMSALGRDGVETSGLEGGAPRSGSSS